MCSEIIPLGRNVYGDDIVLESPKRVCEEEPLYQCTVCNYSSSRSYNVQRHQLRIHSPWTPTSKARKPRICCGRIFLTKGEFYYHCEMCHPDARLYTVNSRTKYKINCNDRLTASTEFHKEKDVLKTLHYDYQRIKSVICSRCSMTVKSKRFNGLFLLKAIDKQIREYLSSEKFLRGKLNLWNTLKKSTAETPVPALTPSTVNSDVEPEERCKTDSSTSTPFLLPVKKLILRKFILHSEQQICQTSKMCKKRSNESDKENVQSLKFRVEKKISVKFDGNVTLPLATEIHRQFLMSIDFDELKKPDTTAGNIKASGVRLLRSG